MTISFGFTPASAGAARKAAGAVANTNTDANRNRCFRILNYLSAFLWIPWQADAWNGHDWNFSIQIGVPGLFFRAEGKSCGNAGVFPPGQASPLRFAVEVRFCFWSGFALPLQ